MVDAVTFSWNADDYGDQPFLGDGEKFAIVSVNLAKDRTVGKYDYTLGGEKCIAMASQQDPFDPSKWKFEFAGAATEVHMLYKLKSDAEPFSFNFELTTREPQLKVTSTGVTGFGDGPNPGSFGAGAAVAPAAPAVATEGGGDAAPAGEGAEPAAAPAEGGTEPVAAEVAPDKPAAEPANPDKKEAEPAAKPKAKAGGGLLDEW